MWGDLAPLGRGAATAGYRRFAWTGTDAVLREWFRGEAERRGLDVVADRAGDLWAWTADPDAEGPGLVVGSHLDSVPDGGAFDGPLGVVSAFAALDELTSRGWTPSRPVGVACFADEEGARFGVACAGSRLLTGVLDPDRAGSLTDDDGTTMAEALTAAGQDPAAPPVPRRRPPPARGRAAPGRAAAPLRRSGTSRELTARLARARADAAPGAGVPAAIGPRGRGGRVHAGRPTPAGPPGLGTVTT